MKCFVVFLGVLASCTSVGAVPNGIIEMTLEHARKLEEDDEIKELDFIVNYFGSATYSATGPAVHPEKDDRGVVKPGPIVLDCRIPFNRVYDWLRDAGAFGKLWADFQTIETETEQMIDQNPELQKLRTWIQEKHSSQPVNNDKTRASSNKVNKHGFEPQKNSIPENVREQLRKYNRARDGLKASLGEGQEQVTAIFNDAVKFQKTSLLATNLTPIMSKQCRIQGLLLKALYISLCEDFVERGETKNFDARGNYDSGEGEEVEDAVRHEAEIMKKYWGHEGLFVQHELGSPADPMNLVEKLVEMIKSWEPFNQAKTDNTINSLIVALNHGVENAANSGDTKGQPLTLINSRILAETNVPALTDIPERLTLAAVLKDSADGKHKDAKAFKEYLAAAKL